MKYRIPLTFLFLLAIFSCDNFQINIIDQANNVEYEVVYLEKHNLFVGKYEVTIKEYANLVGPQIIPELERRIRAYNRRYPWANSLLEYPAILTWEEASFFAKGIGMRLPTEKEWISIAIGGMYTKNDGNILRGAFCFTSSIIPKPVGFHKNRFGIYDMLGNASEWISHTYVSVNDGLERHFSIGTFWSSCPYDKRNFSVTKRHSGNGGVRCVTEINN